MPKRLLLSTSLAALAVLATLSAVPAYAQPLAIVGGAVHPVEGAPIADGIVVMDGARVIAVGARGAVAIPEGARRLDATGKTVTPGLIDAMTATGLVEVSSVSSTRDAALDVEDPVRAAFRVTYGLNPRSVVIPVTRLGGVTTVAAVPSGGVVAGQGAVLDLAGVTVDQMLVKDRAAMYAAFDSDAAEAAGEARGGLALRLREAFEDARFYAANREDYDRGATRAMHVSRLDLEALGPVVRGRLPLVVRASRASDIDAALDLARTYDLRLVVAGGEEAWLRADTLARAGVPVIVRPLSNLPTAFDRIGTRFDNAARLAEAGVPVVLSTFDTHNARNLRFEAGNAVRAGMAWDAALRAVTLAPARMLNVDDSHGSLAPGKMANVVVWSGDPFEFATEAEHVFIRGREVEHDSRQERLLERYRTLDGPASYRGAGR